jgi:hypothetical protein
MIRAPQRSGTSKPEIQAAGQAKTAIWIARIRGTAAVELLTRRKRREHSRMVPACEPRILSVLSFWASHGRGLCGLLADEGRTIM